jgi:hypothetical protein
MAMLMARVEKLLWAPALAIAVATATAQTRPDFSGRWTAVPDSPAPAGPTAQPSAAGIVTVASIASMGSGLGADITITQNPSAITIERAQFSQYDMQPPIKFVYALDGSDSRNAVNMGRGPQESVGKAVWQDAALVITTTYRFVNPGDGKPMTTEVRQVFTLDGSATLVVAVTRSAAPGGQPTTTRQTYKKS